MHAGKAHLVDIWKMGSRCVTVDAGTVHSKEQVTSKKLNPNFKERAIS